MTNIYALTHVPPELGAYALAKYSRSRMSLKESLLELSADQTRRFLNAFYFDYGHASIADLAHVAMAVENVSIMAAMEIVDEPLWDGQERSTRYQDFSRAEHYRPGDAGPEYDAALNSLQDQYRRLFAEAETALGQRHPKPSEMSDSTYRRTIRARSFDIARYWLPLATLTSLGQITSARVLETQLRRLLSSPHAEVRAVGAEMKAAVTERPAYNYLLELAQRKGLATSPAFFEVLGEHEPVLPTLAKYIEPNPYRHHVAATAQKMAEELLADVPLKTGPPVVMHPIGDITAHHLAATLYAHSNRDYGSIRDVVDALPPAVRGELLDAIFSARGPHDPWPETFRGGSFLFDCIADMGAFRDLNRHRRLSKTVQPLSFAMRYETPAPLAELAIGKDFGDEMEQHYRQVEKEPSQHRRYLLPLAHRRRFLLSLDAAEAAYIIELRSQSAGHFSYRAVAHAMHRAMAQHAPQLARHIRATPPDAFDLFSR